MRNRTPRRSVALDLRQPSYARVRPAAISAAHTPLGRCCCAGDCRMTSVTSMYPLAALRKGKRRRPGYVHMIQVMDHDDAPKLVALASTRGIDRHFLRTPNKLQEWGERCRCNPLALISAPSRASNNHETWSVTKASRPGTAGCTCALAKPVARRCAVTVRPTATRQGMPG
jgi:hypothetical protein